MVVKNVSNLERLKHVVLLGVILSTSVSSGCGESASAQRSEVEESASGLGSGGARASSFTDQTHDVTDSAEEQETADDADSGTESADATDHSAHTAAGAASAAGASAAGASAAGASAGSAAAGSGGDTSHDMASMSGLPHPDPSTFPEGSEGYSDERLESTTEQPAVAGDGVGAFRTFCDYSHMAYDDPIVFPGKPGASHLHAFFGNTLTGANSTTESLQTTGNSTCRGGIVNRSGYWVPALLDRSGTPVRPERIEVYYKTGYLGLASNEIKKIPEGLRMVSGNAKASAPQEHSYWGCHDNYVGHKTSVPNCGANDYPTMVVEFPQCWDGKNLDSTDHISHMAYADGGCPASHPYAIPAITFNVLYKQAAGGMDGYRLSSDMYSSSEPGGYSAHGDWLYGWDQDFVDEIVENCVSKGLDCHSHLLGDGRALY